MSCCVIGIDPSLACTGVVAWFGGDKLYQTVIETARENKKRGIYAADDDVRRILYIVGELQRVVASRQCKLAVERLGGSKSARAAKAFGLITAAIATWAYEHDHEIGWVMPSDAKLTLGGKKNASKDEMVEAAKKWHLLDLDLARQKREAVADAFAMLLASNYRPTWLRKGASP